MNDTPRNDKESRSLPVTDAEAQPDRLLATAGEETAPVAPDQEAPPPPQPDELEQECQALGDRFEACWRRAKGAIPSTAELAEIRALQSSLRHIGESARRLAGEAGPRLAQLERERDAYRDAAARARADFLNYQDRTRRERQQLESQTLREYLWEMLAVLDNIEITLAQGRKSREKADGDQPLFDSFYEAAHLIFEQLRNQLRTRGLEEIPAEGQIANPYFHEVVQRLPHPERQHNQVLEVLRSGYLWQGQVLRPAQVIVANNPDNPPPKKEAALNPQEPSATGVGGFR